MVNEEVKLYANLGVYERMVISGPEAAVAIQCYPGMTVVDEKYVVDYAEPLTPELVQALADKWGLTILWRGKEYACEPRTE